MADRPRIKDAGRRNSANPDRDPSAAKPPGDEPAARTRPGVTDTAPGQLARDDRGNISWEWSDDPDLQADDVVGNTARIRALAPVDLTIDDDDRATLPRDPEPVRKTQQSGYNPYESGQPTKQSWTKKRDLRELGKWIALKKRLRNKSGKD